MNIKWKNYGLWVALGALVVMIVVDATNVTPEKVQGYVELVLGLLVAAGIVSNPSNGKGFVDANGDGIPDHLQKGDE